MSRNTQKCWYRIEIDQRTFSVQNQKFWIFGLQLTFKKEKRQVRCHDFCANLKGLMVFINRVLRRHGDWLVSLPTAMKLCFHVFVDRAYEYRCSVVSITSHLKQSLVDTDGHARAEFNGPCKILFQCLSKDFSKTAAYSIRRSDVFIPTGIEDIHLLGTKLKAHTSRLTK